MNNNLLFYENDFNSYDTILYLLTNIRYNY